MYQVENILKSLNKSKFRSSFSLKQKDLEYIEKKGLSEIKKHAYDFLEKRLVPADIPNDGTVMYDLDLKGPIGLVIGNEGTGVSRLVKENCDFIAGIPMKGEIGSLNASVAMGILSYEIVRQRRILES